MEEKKLTDDEIVKAYIHCVLKRGDCDNCLYDEVGCGVDGNDLIKIINRQKAEIERLTEEANQDTVTHIDICTQNLSLRKQNAELRKQVGELTKRNFELAEKGEKVCIAYKQVVKDTAKEIFKEIFESCVFSFKGNDDYKKGFCDALEQYDKQLRDLAKQNGVEVE
jgi:predicted transcriptional regulator